MTNVLVCLQVCSEYLSLVHGVLSCLSHVDRCLDGASKLEFVGLDWHNTDERHLNDELLWLLVVKAVLLDAPASSFKEDTLDVGTCFESLSYLPWVCLLSDHGVEGRLIERPHSCTTSGLKESGQIGLWNMKSR